MIIRRNTWVINKANLFTMIIFDLLAYFIKFKFINNIIDELKQK